jgi:exodeoxyribonuclease-5
MAGRVAVLFAQGVEPKNVAAITFTEFAASELRIRIDRFVNDLSTGTIPPDLESAFPKEVSAKQRANLMQAKKTFDQLVCTTIHGFAQALVKPYPAEAGIDPGAEIIDPAEGDLAFDERYQAWLKGHLSGEGADDIVAELVIADETRGLGLLRSIADFLRHNRDARPGGGVWSSNVGQAFLAATTAFEKEIARFAFREDQTNAASQAFIDMIKTLGSVMGTKRPLSRTLIEAAVIPRNLACFTQPGAKRQLRTKGAWEKAAAAAGKRKTDGSMAFDACLARYDACHEAFNALMGMIAGELLGRIVETMKGLLLDWSEYKHAAALLDFDDLLYTVRDLLAKNEAVRQTLARRFRHVLVDEFQDTDPLQIDILWRLCGEAPKDSNPQPLSRVLRPGALFLVGDPKQAIYRFRGADVNAYLGARAAIGEEALLEIVANFRSVEPILDFVNAKFDKPLSLEAGQPGFTALVASCAANGDALSVAALDIAVEGDDKPSAQILRDAEADRVAELCTRLVGNMLVRDRDTMRKCRFGDIALLAPVGTELWRFEEAIEQRGIPVSTQAGKGFFRRQEIQDLIAVTRTIADVRDTLALGALLRGPLIGLTEAELLDISDGLPANPDQPDRLAHLTLWTETEHVNHALARRILEILKSLAKRSRSTTPYMLLSDAVSQLDLRAQLRQRFRTSADRALANVDLFLETARAYDVRGLRAFARDMRANWEEQVRQVEGRPDAEEQSVSLITIHASKGLEWPIVIPINMTGTPKSESGLMHDFGSGEFSIPVLNVEPAGYSGIKSWNETEHARERVRLWYVAATRARDLLVLPRHSATLSDKSWARIVALDIAALPPIDPANLGAEMALPAPSGENTQTRAQFGEEAKRISEAAITIHWHRPSLHEADAPPSEPVPVFSDPESVDATVSASEVAGSATRGIILHKLMEEVLTGETQDTPAELERRAAELLAQLGREPSADPKSGISPREVAATVTRTLILPEIAELRPHLIPEHTVFGIEREGRTETLVSGIADAVARDATDQIETIVDWKSDVEMDASKLAAYKSQLGDYRKQTGARQALLVLMTPGTILNV